MHLYIPLIIIFKCFDFITDQVSKDDKFVYFAI